MSATNTTGGQPASSNPRRRLPTNTPTRPPSTRSGQPHPEPSVRTDAARAASPAHRSPMVDRTEPRLTFYEQLTLLRQQRNGRLRSLWQLTAQQRIAAMRRGELTLEQLAAWSARYPDQVPLLNGEFEWLAALTPEAAE